MMVYYTYSYSVKRDVLLEVYLQSQPGGKVWRRSQVFLLMSVFMEIWSMFVEMLQVVHKTSEIRRLVCNANTGVVDRLAMQGARSSRASSAYCHINWPGSWTVNSLRPGQDRRHFADNIFKCIFVNENVWISLRISLKFVPKFRINNIPALVQILAWRRRGDKPLSGTMMVRLSTEICVTRPQWVYMVFLGNWLWKNVCKINQIISTCWSHIYIYMCVCVCVQGSDCSPQGSKKNRTDPKATHFFNNNHSVRNQQISQQGI